MKVLIRTDASSSIGYGHVMRCLVLAQKYQNISFACEDLVGNLNQKIALNYPLFVLKSSEVLELIELINQEKFDLVIIDSYGISYLDEKQIKEATQVQLMVLDDTYEKHYCDMVLNHNIYAQKNHYKNRVLENTKLLCGSKYTLIRDEFKQFHYRRNQRKLKKLSKVLISLGATDENNISMEVLKVLKRFKTFHIVLVTSSSNSNLTQLVTYVRNNKNVQLIVDSSEMAKLIYESDFAIITPSVVVQEVLYLKKKFIAIQTASNQRYMTEYLKKKRYSVLSGFSSKTLYNKIKNIELIK